MLWRYFGLTAVAIPPAEETGVEAKVDRLTLQIEELNRRLVDSALLRSLRSGRRAELESQADRFIGEMSSLAVRQGVDLLTVTIGGAIPNAVTLQYEAGKLTDLMRREILARASLAGIEVTIEE